MASAGKNFRIFRPRSAAARPSEIRVSRSLIACCSIGHTNFIVNDRGATARDILALIEHVRGTVEAKFGIRLETEVKVIGEDPPAGENAGVKA